VTAPATSVETPTAPTVTTPTAPEGVTTPTAPEGEATEVAPGGQAPAPSGQGSPRKGSKGKKTQPLPGGVPKADLPKCSEVGEGPAPCVRPDGTVRVPEPL
jgi:hypothetical protein